MFFDVFGNRRIFHIENDEVGTKYSKIWPYLARLDFITPNAKKTIPNG